MRRTPTIESTAPEIPSPDTLAGIVIRADTREPVRTAQVQLTSSLPPTTVMTDSFGRFHLPRLGTAPFVLRTRGLGMAARTDTLTVADGVRMLTIALEPAVFDGPCRGVAMERVRNPWWHFW